MKYCDLHNHSVHSDGSYTPSELVKYAVEKGISAIALTDHNTADGYDEFVKSAKENGIDFVCGCELTTDYLGKEVHLLCMFIDEKSIHRVQDFTKIQLENKKKSNIDLEKALIQGGYNISLAEMHKKYGANINRAHFAKELVLKGYMETTGIAFDTLLKSGNGFYTPPERLELLDGIEKVRSWGCVPVIAHPLLSVTRSELEELLPAAKEKGLVGMEVYYPKFTDEDKKYLHSICQKHGLIASGGSDYHGNMKSEGDLNEAKAPYKCYEELLKFYNTIHK